MRGRRRWASEGGWPTGARGAARRSGGATAAPAPLLTLVLVCALGGVVACSLVRAPGARAAASGSAAAGGSAAPAAPAGSAAIAVPAGSAAPAVADPLSAPPLARIAAYTDAAARYWAGHLDAQGHLHDPLTAKTGRSYGPTMVGYAMMRAGVRAGDQKLIGDGIRTVEARSHVPARIRGVFDLLGLATAYNYAHVHLAQDPRFLAVKHYWVHYLRTMGAPRESAEVHGCIISPTCFHNHEAVAALAKLELYETGVHSRAAGALLVHRSELLTQAIDFAAQTAPRFQRGHARASGPGTRKGLGLLSDSTLFPLAYDSLCSAMLQQVVARLGTQAPAAARSAARAASETLGSLMGPDGDTSYIGRRQEGSWSLAASVLSGTTAAHEFASERGVAGRAQTIAARAFARLERNYPLRADGLSLVPRRIVRASYNRGVDIESLGFNGLTMWLLNEAIDTGPAAAAPRPLTADGNGSFVDPDQQRFAAVREGSVWFAVHAQHETPDLRSDFGLVALKLRVGPNRWVDLLRPRPFVDATPGLPSAGPVLDVPGSTSLVPLPGRISVTGGGEVVVSTRFAPFGMSAPATGVTKLRFTPGARGVTMRLRPPGGKSVAMTTFVPASASGARRGSVADAEAVATLSGARSSHVMAGFASCCDAHLVGVTLRTVSGAGGTVSYTVRARRVGEQFKALPAGTSDLERILLIAGAVLVMGVAVLLSRGGLGRRRRGRGRERGRRDRGRGRGGRAGTGAGAGGPRISRGGGAAGRSSRAPRPSTGTRSRPRSP